MKLDRVILHSDCNGFYASVETVYRPELAAVPMAVCGDPESRHGIILAKNELAKRYKIQTAEPVSSALRKCPELVLVRAHHDRYREFSRRVNRIYLEYTDQVEPFSVDESWLDVTGSLHLFGDGKKIADELRRRVRKEIGITISVGVSFNKVFAKLGSDYKKPDATTVIQRQDVERILYPLPVEAMLLVGGSAADRLRKMRVCTIGDLARCPRTRLEKLLGKLGGTLSDYARGLDQSPVRKWGEHEEIKSVGNSITFRRDLQGMEDIRLGITTLADRVAERLRRHQMKCTAVQITVKNPALRVITRQKVLDAPANSMEEIRDAALELIRKNWDPQSPVRLLGITGLSLCHEDEGGGEQLSFFAPEKTENREKAEHLGQAIDKIREKLGDHAISYASVLNNDLGISTLKIDGKKETD